MDEYERMKQEVASTPDLKTLFTRIHHFSCQEFESDATSYEEFLAYKEKPRVFQKNGQNRQTVRRCWPLLKLIGSVEIGNRQLPKLGGLSSGNSLTGQRSWR